MASAGHRAQSGVLVTGAHRSGTTWLGRALAAADDLHYVQEPFNIVARLRWLPRRPDHQFLYLTDENAGPWTSAVERIMALRPPVAAQVQEAVRQGRGRRLFVLAREARQARREGRRPMVKDPIALFSTPWLAERFGLVPVILVRRPVAFVGSLKARQWDFDFRHWLEQPLLMDELLADFRGEIEEQVRRPGSIAEQGVVQWNAFYSVIDRFRSEHPDWHVLRYEDLAASPEERIGSLYADLGLELGERQRRVIRELSSGEGGEGRSAIDVRRDSRATLDTWRDRLTDEEVEQVSRDTAEVASRFYDDLR